ncbi:hypothetical protein [Paenibacillus sp. FSL H7-0331]|jgi:putative copper export protein|uniref:hypothetical protein n=1 Tax=Paenibacillus sp. FSL H7-0331 TaxID=1920421 RepID=UPI00096D533B|nr:hypothetical protein [Paenibacillus sp. FSL H7-0331]OMF05933.1 hypothetical protein BK127_31980 [Paenibacillus sp. FSL H7-0331]
MFGFMLFLHLAGLVIWLGSLFAIMIMLIMLNKQLGSLESNTLAQRIIRTFSRFAHPSAVFVLISGILMIIQMGMGSGKPLWLEVMEKGGGTIILLGLIFTGILGSKVKKRLSIPGEAHHVKLSGYMFAISTVIVLTLSVVLVVSLKI